MSPNFTLQQVRRACREQSESLMSCSNRNCQSHPPAGPCLRNAHTKLQGKGTEERWQTGEKEVSVVRFGKGVKFSSLRTCQMVIEQEISCW